MFAVGQRGLIKGAATASRRVTMSVLIQGRLAIRVDWQGLFGGQVRCLHGHGQEGHSVSGSPAGSTAGGEEKRAIVLQIGGQRIAFEICCQATVLSRASEPPKASPVDIQDGQRRRGQERKP